MRCKMLFFGVDLLLLMLFWNCDMRSWSMRLGLHSGCTPGACLATPTPRLKKTILIPMCQCSPPPRNERDQEGIWRGLENGTFTVLSSDHCPFLYEDTEFGKKSVISDEYPLGRFRYIPNGCPGVETRLPLVFSEGRLGVMKFVEVMSTNAAKLYGLYPRKGALLPGLSDADLVIVRHFSANCPASPPLLSLLEL